MLITAYVDCKRIFMCGLKSKERGREREREGEEEKV